MNCTRIARKVAFVLLAASSLHGQGVFAQRAPKISQAQIDAMFANMRAHAPWNVDGPLLWSFFFLDTDKSKLQSAGADLAAQGYRLADISPTKTGDRFRLRVERVETLTPATLYSRDVELEALARKFGIQSYDGMDVGPAPKVDAGSASEPKN
jgi:hypothetical protein